MADELVGMVSEFFARPVVAGIDLKGTLEVGDKIKIKGHTTDIEFMMNSMQIDNASVQVAGPGDSVGVKVPDRARKGDTVYRVTA
jgi:translation elongation factor EF-1alpha